MCAYNFLMTKKELELMPSELLTLAKNSVFPIKMLPSTGRIYWIFWLKEQVVARQW